MVCEGSSYRAVTLQPPRLVENLAVPSTADSSCISFRTQVLTRIQGCYLFSAPYLQGPERTLNAGLFLHFTYLSS